LASEPLSYAAARGGTATSAPANVKVFATVYKEDKCL
jgi:hypothetical protein